jgi:hypothetical protein
MARIHTAVVLGLLVPGVPAPGQAQQSTAAAQAASALSDARWSAWLGCWTPAARAGTAADTQLCIVPSADHRGVQMHSFAGDQEVLTELVIADGTPQTTPENNCSGERSTRWANSGTRMFSQATLACAGQPASKTSSVSALVTSDQWIEVQVSAVSGREQVRTRRFWRSSTEAPRSVAAVVGALPGSRVVVRPPSVDDVIEASGAMPATGVEAWLAESRVRVAVDRRALVRLSDAQVSSNVIDLMVALAYPQKFEVKRASSGGGGGGGWFSGGSVLDGWYPGEWGYLADVYGLGLFGVPGFFGANGYYQAGGLYYLPAVGSGGGAPEEAAHGQVVNGQGYTRVQPREPYRGTASRQNGSNQGTSSNGAESSGGGGSSSGSGGGVSTSGYSSDGGSSTGLTAVPS